VRSVADWNFAAKQTKITPDGRYFPPSDRDSTQNLIQIVSSGPDTKWANVYNGISRMISEANESIFIQTPYFAPTDNIFESLRIAALAGVDVRIVIPANPDHLLVKWCSLSYLGELLEAGVRVYEYTDGFIHSKMVIIDALAASVGTTNMDIRSFKLNFEVNAFIYDTALAARLKERFFGDLAMTREIKLDAYRNRPMMQKIKEAVARLFSPLL